MNPKPFTFRFLVLLTCLGLLLAACGPKTTPTPAAPADKQPGYPAASQNQAGYPNPPAVPQPAAEAAYPSPGLTIDIIKADGSTATVKDTDLRAIPMAAITAGDKVENGILLGALLNAQGVLDFQQVVVTGSGGSLALSKDQVTQDVILSFAQDGSALLVDSTRAADQWVKGVNKIEVK